MQHAFICLKKQAGETDGNKQQVKSPVALIMAGLPQFVLSGADAVLADLKYSQSISVRVY